MKSLEEKQREMRELIARKKEEGKARTKARRKARRTARKRRSKRGKGKWRRLSIATSSNRRYWTPARRRARAARLRKTRQRRDYRLKAKARRKADRLAKAQEKQSRQAAYAEKLRIAAERKAAKEQKVLLNPATPQEMTASERHKAKVFAEGFQTCYRDLQPEIERLKAELESLKRTTTLRP
jgi:hypothetical protein